MLKQINLKITKIKYDGNSIGDDIHLEVQCLDRFKWLDKKIKNGTGVEVDFELGSFTADHTPYFLPFSIVIVEKDLIFNDVGRTEAKIKVDLKNDSIQISTHNVVVKERRGINIGQREASYSITVEASVMPIIKYIPKTKDGWLVVLRGKDPESLPTFLKVRHDKIERGREYFTVLEGVWAGEVFSIKLDGDKSSLLDDNPQSGPAFLKYSISKRLLILGRDKYNAVDYQNDHLKKGFYDVEIADSPHNKGIPYLAQAKYAKVWFRVGHDGERYIHAGGRSAGCVTLIELKKYDEFCEILLKSRKGDGRSIGTLEAIA